MSDQRGKVTQVVFSIEYPDGSTKTSTYVPQAELRAVLLDQAYMTDEMKGLFEVSATDWRKNPAMIIVDGKLLKPNCDFPDCQTA